MMINQNNYEAYILDYYEGRLSAEETAELMLFFENHPELKQAFDDFENITIDEDLEKIKFSYKNDLKKIILTENDFISYIENLTPHTETARIEYALKQNPDYEKELLLFKKTILTADKITFEGKNKLKKKEQKVIPLYYYIAAAASVALLLYFFFSSNDIDTNLQAHKPNTKDSVFKKEIHQANQPAIAASNAKPDSTNKPVPIAKLKKKKRESLEKKFEINNSESQIVFTSSANINNDSSLLAVANTTAPDTTANKLTYYEEEVIVRNEESINHTNTADEFVSVGNYLSEKLFGVNKDKSKVSPGKLYYIAGLLKRAGSKNIKTKEEYDYNNNMIAYSVAYKNFEISRKK